MAKTIFGLISGLIGGILMITSSFAATENVISEKQALAAYLAENENIDPPWVLNHSQFDESRHVTVETYTLHSQYWPKANMSSRGTLWKHTLIIYLPETIKTNQALLFVNGGTRNNVIGLESPPQHQLDFARIAASTQSVVVDLHDIPNQYLKFEDNIPRREDSIVAYTWNRYMDDPENGYYWPLQLPMTKAVIKAMDAVQQIVAQKNNTQVDQFVVAGLSKRGLATWLAALSDERINAIIPVVIDMLNVKENLNLIYACYNNTWPPALQSFVEENIHTRINTPTFEKLMNIVDPLNYLTGENADYFKQRLSIPKYIISASGDDFFVPGSLNLYLDQLPGETRVRIIPNQPHYIDMTIVENAMLSYYQMIINNIDRPILEWKMNNDGSLKRISTNKKPTSVKLWEAENTEIRDFRFVSNIIYHATELTGTCDSKHCHYSVNVDSPTKGWKASFVEVTFDDIKGEPFVLTTPMNVSQAP